MNKSFEIIDNIVIVKDDLGYETTRDVTNNIEEILITENNIEEIDMMCAKEEKTLERQQKELNSLGIPKIILIILHTLLTILNFSLNNIGLGILWLLNASLNIFIYTTQSNSKKKKIKISKRKINFLENELNIEKEKLSELNKDKINDAMCITPTKEKLNSSIRIKLLNPRLEDIELYENHKRKIMKLYKKGILEDELFEACVSRDTINFINHLAHSDLNSKNKVKQKVLKK